jgi:hypothetical protein
MRVFEYVDRRGIGVYTAWYQARQARQRAALDAKLDAVRKAGELPPRLFRGPVKHRNQFYPNTWKLTVNCDGALRPLACKGPIDPENEWTILVPVIEVGNQYPPGVFQEAEERRLEIVADPTRRRELRGDDDQ